MSFRHIVVVVLLVAGVGLEAVCCLGLIVMRDVYDRLHYAAPGAFGAGLIAIAVVVQESFSLIGNKALATAAHRRAARAHRRADHPCDGAQPADPGAWRLAPGSRAPTEQTCERGRVPVTAVQAVAIVAVAIAGGSVALLTDPLRETFLLGIYGMTLSALFFALQAPDVALSEIVVATIAVPVMIVLAVAKLQEHEDE